MKDEKSSRVLVITGNAGALRSKEYRSQDLYKKKLNLVMKEFGTYGLKELKKSKSKSPSNPVASYFAQSLVSSVELTEVVLCGLLKDAEVQFVRTTFSELAQNPNLAQKLLAETNCVFASSTLLTHAEEIENVAKILKKPHNKVVFGGALAGIIWQKWDGSPYVDILAVGYGEFLVPSLAEWIKSDFTSLDAPSSGKIIAKKHTTFLFGGTPATLSLDSLPTPDWNLIQDNGSSPSLISYESVRGCPYRCAFCNYPFLFDDTKFRTKSAKKMADDWEYYVKECGVKYISCLDSLFTMPKDRIIAFCNELIKRNIRVKWLAYARSTDLNDLDLTLLLKEAGAQRLFIGIESGNDQILLNMNKKATVEQNARGIENCHRAGIFPVALMMVGFPGETEKTVEDTYSFLKKTKPTFHTISTFDTRVEGALITGPELRQKFGLQYTNDRTISCPTWKHKTMTCLEAAKLSRRLRQKIALEEISLDHYFFSGNAWSYDSNLHPTLLDFQKRFYTGKRLEKGIFSAIHWSLDRKLKKALHSFDISPTRASSVGCET